MPTQKFPENYLYKLWTSGFLFGKQLLTDNGIPVTIIQPGIRNDSNGPDFLNSIVLFGTNKLLTPIEFHVSAEEWTLHGHHKDPEFNSCQLHISFYNDQEIEIKKSNGHPIPNITLSTFLSFQDMMTVLTASEKLQLKEDFPCESHIQFVPTTVKSAWVEELGTITWMRKVNHWRVRLNFWLEHPDYIIGKRYVWDQLLFEGLFRGLGYPYNAESFEKIAQEFPVLQWPEKVQSQDEWTYVLFQLSGIQPKDDPNFIEWKMTKEKIVFPVLEKNTLKTGGLRPVNQPEYRLKSMATLLTRYMHSGFLKPTLILLETGLQMGKNPEQLIRQFLDVFQSEGDGQEVLGKQKLESILFNTWFPILYLYAELQEREDLQQAIMKLVTMTAHHQTIRLEQDIRRLTGLTEKTWMSHWGHLDLGKNLCQHKKCLECRVGSFILKN